jgi:hypothetical protein
VVSDAGLDDVGELILTITTSSSNSLIVGIINEFD